MTEKQNLRALVKSFYDAQKLRIEVGNRICQNVRVRLGQAPSTKTEEMPEKAQQLLREMVSEYKRLADSLSNTTNQKRVKELAKHEGVIHSLFEYYLVEHYYNLMDTEGKLEKNITLRREGGVKP